MLHRRSTTRSEESLDDAELKHESNWKKIQQNTFTRWCNQHLKDTGMHINDLETDLSDGLILIRLIEVLSSQRLPKHNQRPTFRSQKLENVSVALKFLQEQEHIRIVNIDVLPPLKRHDMAALTLNL